MITCMFEKKHSNTSILYLEAKLERCEGGGDCIFIYSRSAQFIISFEVNFISQKISWAEPGQII